MHPFSLSSHTALVTGSSQGIGLALALGLQQAGARVVFHGKDAPPSTLPPGTPFLAGDLLAADGPAHLVSAAFAQEPALDRLVCNAGSFFDGPFLTLEPATFEKTVHLNVRANYFLIQAFARELIARGRPGAVVIVSSTNGYQSEEDSTAYDTSKGASVMMTRTLAQALAPHGIRVNGIAPGLIRTPLNAWMTEKPETVRHYEKKILLGRIGTPDDCAGAAVFLLSAASHYVTGQILVVDGGLTTGQIGRM
jgi:NAD(P)-dependent dehydrogenase (short-subunit alcohol dehydrogenase family)